MLASKGLLLKGLLGVGAAVSVTCVGLNYSGLFTGKREEAININIPGEGEVKTPGKLLDKVGLSCSLDTATTTAGVECTKKEGEEVKIKVKQEGKTFELSSLGDGGKIKVYKDEGYENKFKFVIEEGDISEGENKLEEFETYEIKEEADASNPETKKYHLTRKTKASEKIKVLLGLDTCPFPGGSETSTCTITNENIKKIKFDGKDGDVTGTGSLQISKVQGDELRDYPLGFKFTLTPESDITIPRGSLGNLSLTNANPTNFMIKKSGSSLTLEEVWTPGELAEKVGLSCTVSDGQSLKTGIECTKKEGTDIKVKQGKTEFNVSSITTGSKIKLYRLTGEDADEYNKGLKFVIGGGSITVGDNKLEEFETYEIKQDGADWKLIRKNESKEEVRKSLGVPCLLPKEGTVTVCDIKGNVFKKIKFGGLKETEASVSGSPNLWIYKPKGNSDYGTFGYRFVLESEEDATFSSSLTIKKGTDTEFKIKREKDSLSLEEVWTVTELGKKVGLNCPGGDSKECTLEGSGIKVFNDDKTKTENGTKPAGSDTKITFEKDTEGYSQGFKFFTTSDVEVEKSSNSVKILGNSSNSATYEIKEMGGTWYLTKKST